MTTAQEQIELTKEWLRVQEMCFKERFNHPLKCVKFNGEEMRLMPAFDLEAGSYEFALAIVEDSPVFRGDELYFFGEKVTATERSMFEQSGWSWNPPRKTFVLNGEELPRPKSIGKASYADRRYGLDLIFDNEVDRHTVEAALIKLFEDK